MTLADKSVTVFTTALRFLNIQLIEPHNFEHRQRETQSPRAEPIELRSQHPCHARRRARKERKERTRIWSCKYLIPLVGIIVDVSDLDETSFRIISCGCEAQTPDRTSAWLRAPLSVSAGLCGMLLCAQLVSFLSGV